MTEYSYELRIPKERVAMLIGKDGEVKKSLEEDMHVKLDIDSQEGEITVSGEDAITLFSVREIIKAVGRGFNPDIAYLLKKADYAFELIPLSEFARNQKDMIRMKGRVIGSEGKSRKIIEELTETYICVYGKTIGIIGDADNVTLARRAINSLLEGSPHSSVYKWLEKKRAEMRRGQLMGE